MTRTTSRNYRNLGLLGKAGLSLCLTVGGTVHSLGQTAQSRGTVNIALANADGMVLLTDSVQSYKVAGVLHPSTKPSQKLFRLDEKTVCSIAGFASETGWARTELNVEVAGIIAEIRDQLSQKPVRELDAKLNAIGFLVGSYIDVVANRHEAASGPGTPDSYGFEVIVAGYDEDGKLKFKKLVLTPVVIQAPDGTRQWSHTTSREEASIEINLSSLLAGIRDISLQVLHSPQEFKTSPVIQKYAQSMRENGGKSLTLNDLVALASEMAAKTADRFPSMVGGDDQIAVLSEGKILKIGQRTFDEPPRPLQFQLIVDMQIQGARAFGMLITDPTKHVVWIRDTILGIKNPPLRLDNQFFYGCEIRDSIVQYHGGLTDFGPTNTVVNSTLFPWHPVPIAASGMTWNWNGFEWNLDPPNTPSLPFELGPRPLRPPPR